MKVIYKRELEMQDGSMARFTLGKEYVYVAVTDTHGAYVENDRGIQHFMSEDFMRQYFAEVVVAKKITIDVAHRLVAYDTDIACMQADYENRKEVIDAQIERLYAELEKEKGRIAERMEEFQALKDEYGVED